MAPYPDESLREEDMNIEKIMTELGFGENEVRELIDIFLESSRSDLDLLENAVRDKHTAGIALYAHSIRGAASNMGLTEVMMAAEDIEMKARSGIFEAGLKTVNSLRTMVERAAAVISMKGSIGA